MTTDVVAAAADWRATAAALHEVADRLVALAPEAARLRGRTGAVTAEALERTVRSLRHDADDAAAGGAALADVAAALDDVRRDPSPEARHRLAGRLHEATRVMRRIHGPTPPTSHRPQVTTGATTAQRAVTASGGHAATAAGVGAALVAGLLTATGPGARIPVNGAAERPPAGPVGTMVPAGRGRSRRDVRSRSRHALPAGTEEEWADEEVRGGPAVLGSPG
jgi:hypothetical protein